MAVNPASTWSRAAAGGASPATMAFAIVLTPPCAFWRPVVAAFWTAVSWIWPIESSVSPRAPTILSRAMLHASPSCRNWRGAMLPVCLIVCKLLVLSSGGSWGPLTCAGDGGTCDHQGGDEHAVGVHFGEREWEYLRGLQMVCMQKMNLLKKIWEPIPSVN